MSQWTAMTVNHDATPHCIILQGQLQTATNFHPWFLLSASLFFNEMSLLIKKKKVYLCSVDIVKYSNNLEAIIVLALTMSCFLLHCHVKHIQEHI